MLCWVAKKRGHCYLRALRPFSLRLGCCVHIIWLVPLLPCWKQAWKTNFIPKDVYTRVARQKRGMILSVVGFPAGQSICTQLGQPSCTYAQLLPSTGRHGERVAVKKPDKETQGDDQCFFCMGTRCFQNLMQIGGCGECSFWAYCADYCCYCRFSG